MKTAFNGNLICLQMEIVDHMVLAYLRHEKF